MNSAAVFRSIATTQNMATSSDVACEWIPSNPDGTSIVAPSPAVTKRHCGDAEISVKLNVLKLIDLFQSYHCRERKDAKKHFSK
jgi:hypothetical protein